MAVSNRDRVGKGLELLATGLSAFVDGEMRAAAPAGSDWVVAVAAVGPGPARRVSLDDPQFLLKTLWDYWNPVFSKVLGRNERSMVSLLRDVRDRWAHNEAFTGDDAYRALDGIQMLLQSVAASSQADEVGRSKDELLRLRYEDAARKAARGPAAVGAETGGLTPWREVVTPHADVRSGTFAQAEFAADLAQVHRGEGADEYRDPVEFFRRTFVTEGLRQLLFQAVQRFANHGGVPVVDLQTTFGGGKTHSLLALYHLFSGVPLDHLPQDVQELVRAAGATSLPTVRRAVLDGAKLRPGQPSEKKDGTIVRTLWGELAWQLGGAEGYRLVAQADSTSTNPGDALAEVFRQFGPALVLIDEWVTYARQLYSRQDLPAGTFDTHFSFAQALTEAARATPGTLVVISIPASQPSAAEPDTGIEVGGIGGREALRQLRAVVGRVETAWRPASATESFEIVRRRLFEPLTDPHLFAARDATARGLGEMYRAEAGEFPAECREPAYVERIKAAYPIHPELFDRLYEDWSTLERFQRTRGVLRLMAAVIHSLWQRNDRSPLILPASLPLDDDTVVIELTKNLEDSWKPIVDADVDGDGSLPAELDRESPNLGRYFAARRVARTVFLGSAPTVRSANRGVEDTRVRLGCAYPGEPIGTFADALRRLSDRATYLYVDGRRYWYDTQPSVTRIARDRAARYAERPDDEIAQDLLDRLRKDSAGRGQRGELSAVHVAPVSSAEVPDEDEVRLVVLGVGAPHARTEDSVALTVAREFLEHRGPAQRLYRNMLIFAAADRQRLDDLFQATAEFLAWKSMADDKVALNLTPFQQGQVDTKLRHANETVDLRLVQPEPAGPIDFDVVRLNGVGSLAKRVSDKLVRDNHLNVLYTPVLLRLQLDRVPLWPPDGHIAVSALWENVASYLYLPRLRDRTVLEGAVADGPRQLLWESEGFAIAERFDDGSRRYLGLVCGGSVGRAFDAVTGTTLLVKPEIALRQANADATVASGVEHSSLTAGQAVDLRDGEAAGPTAPPAVVLQRRFHGSARLDPQRLNRDVARLTQEVVEHLTTLVGTEVDVTLEVHATNPDGFPEDIVRTVSENAQSLHLLSHGFEEQ
jgi:predicted AAA+ superfamily ATPase